MRKLAFCICENKDADQLRGSREADQRLCFRFTDSTIPLLPKSEISLRKFLHDDSVISVNYIQHLLLPLFLIIYKKMFI